MPISTVYRTTPSLGPSIATYDTAYWFNPPATYDFDGTTPLDDLAGASPKLGTMVKGSDGHDYVVAQAGASHAASARLDLNETTWATSANASGAWMVPADIVSGPVASGAYFFARRYAI